jgi:hypothetical protein
MRITQTDIAEILFTDDEILTFEDVVDILRMKFTYKVYDDEEVGVKIIIPCMNKKIDFRFCILELTQNYLSSEWMIRREIVNNLKLESWLNTPIDCSTENTMYFKPQNFGINVNTTDLDFTFIH